MEFKQILKIVVVCKFENKKTLETKADMWVGRVITNMDPEQVVTMLCFVESMGLKLMALNPGQMVACTSMLTKYGSKLEEENQVKTSRASKVLMSTMPFVYNQDLYMSYQNASVKTFEEVRNSPLKRRVSIQGEVTGVEVFDTPAHKRQILHMQDERGQLLNATVWKDHYAERFEPNQMVLMKNVEVTEYNQRKQVKSTIETVVETPAEETKAVITVDSKDEDTNTVSNVAGKTYILESGIEKVAIGCKIEAVLNGKRIVEYKFVDED